LSPNGSGLYRKLYLSGWTHVWSIVHLNLLDEKYYTEAFKSKSFIIGLSPYNTKDIMAWVKESRFSPKQIVLSLDGKLSSLHKKVPQYGYFKEML